jgi:uncharacterized cupin superfamily protein
MPNIFDPQWDQRRDHPGFVCDRAFVGRQAGASRLGASVWKVPPGEAAFPYHWHNAEEEMLIVLEGTLALRTPDGWRELSKGDLVVFPVGPEGAHQLVNRGDAAATFVAFSSNAEVEKVVYPDSGKTLIAARRNTPEEDREIYVQSTAVDYWHGEKPPA